MLDSIGQAVQTLRCRKPGHHLTDEPRAIRKVDCHPGRGGHEGSVNYTNVTGTVAIAADQSRVTGTTTVATGDTGATASVKGGYTINASNLSGATSGDTLTVSNGSISSTFEYLTGTNTASGGATGFTNAASLTSDIQAAFSGATVTNSSGTITVQSTSAQDYTTNYTASGTSTLTTLGASTTATDGDKLTVNDGTHTSTFRYVAANASAANGTFTDATSLAAAINNGASSVSSDITAANSSGNLQLTAAKTVSITVGGALGTDYGIGTSATTDNYNSTLAGVSGNLTVGVAGDVANTLTFGTGNGQISTATELTAALGGITDVTEFDQWLEQYQLLAAEFRGRDRRRHRLGGDRARSLGRNHEPKRNGRYARSSRSTLQNQYNALLTQVDQLASDSSYNGVNLLNGDNLKVAFNETGSSSLTIGGVNLNSTGLGLTQITGTGFQDNNNITKTLNNINTALDTLRSQASTFGSNLTTVQTRQDFTNNLISTLQTGSDNLVLADTNEEGANLLAEQTRQQLSTTALSLSSQADQAVLKLFG